MVSEILRGSQSSHGTYAKDTAAGIIYGRCKNIIFFLLFIFLFCFYLIEKLRKNCEVEETFVKWKCLQFCR